MWAILLPRGLALAACGAGGTDHVPSPAPQPTAACGSERYMWYPTAKGSWREYDRVAAILPTSPRAGLSLAIPEAWAGSCYGGLLSEACGECWKRASLNPGWTEGIVVLSAACPASSWISMLPVQGDTARVVLRDNVRLEV